MKKKKLNEIGIVGSMMNAAFLNHGFAMLNELVEQKDPRDNDEYYLGNDLFLKVDTTIKDNRDRYGKLYHKNGYLVSEKYFRLGGLCYGFNNKPYCMIIMYEQPNGALSGIHCIIDTTGKIVLRADSSFDSGFYYLDGVIATKKGTIYDLLTGQPIIHGSNRIESKEFYFVENKYDKEYPYGVYKIDKKTGTYEIFN